MRASSPNSPALCAEELSISGVEQNLANINKHPQGGTVQKEPT